MDTNTILNVTCNIVTMHNEQRMLTGHPLTVLVKQYLQVKVPSLKNKT